MPLTVFGLAFSLVNNSRAHKYTVFCYFLLSKMQEKNYMSSDITFLFKSKVQFWEMIS